jgi:hypothetical protein
MKGPNLKDTAQMLLKNRLSAASDYANRIGSGLFPVREAKCSVKVFLGWSSMLYDKSRKAAHENRVLWFLDAPGRARTPTF